MKTINHRTGSFEFVELISVEILIKTTQDALDVMGNTQATAIVLHSHNFEPDFFDLSTKKLGDILQKFSNYQVKLAIIGNFDQYPSKVLKDFIYESNRYGDYLFVSSLDEVKKRWRT